MKTIVDYASKVKEQHALNKTLAPVETDLTDASRAYAIGEQFIYDGDLFKAKTAIAQHDALVLNTNYEAADDITTQIKNKTVTTDPVPTEGSTNPVQSNGVFVEDRNIYAVMGEMGAKNLLPFDLDEIKAANTEGTWAGNVYTRRNVSFTVNSDYSVDVVADGITNTQASGFFYYSASGAEKFVGKSVTLTGCPISGGSSTYNLQAYRAASVDGSGGTEKDTGSGVTLDWMNNGTGIKAMVAISIGAEVSCNAKFKPMLRYAEDIDSTYQPYAKTNQELTAENQTLTKKTENIVDVISENGAKNLLPNTGATTTINHVVYTVNADGTVTATSDGQGTQTSVTDFFVNSKLVLPNGTYKITGCPTGGSRSSYSLWVGLRNTADSGWVSSQLTYEDGWEFTVDNSVGYVAVSAELRPNYSITTPVIFKPMITLASQPNSDYAHYVPYAMTNRELTEVKTGSYTPTVTSGGTGTCSGTVIWHRIGKLVFIYASNLAITMTSTNADLVALSLPFDAESNQTIPLYYANSSFFDLSNSVGWVSPVVNAFHIMKNGNSVKGSNWGTAAVNIGFAGCYLAK